MGPDKAGQLLTPSERRVVDRYKSTRPGFSVDLRDDDSWNAYLAERLSEEQLGILAQGWSESDAASDLMIRPPANPWEATFAERNWMLDVLAINVQLKPAGRVVLRDPRESTYRVEIYWVKTEKPTRGKEALQEPKSVHVIGEPTIVVGAQPDLNDYFTAFLLHISGTPPMAAFKRAPRARPAPGQAADTDFYRQLIAAEKALRADGHRAPAKELARRYGEEYATVRSWLSRGKRYLDKQTKEGQ